MDINLTDLFEVVLKSAIEAQFKANEYSAELAERLEPKKFAASIDEPNKIITNPFFPIPNSNFEKIGVNFKVDINQIETDLERSHSKIIRHIRRDLDKQLPHLQQVNAFVKPERLSRELMKCSTANPENIYDMTVDYFALYLHYFSKKLTERHGDLVPDFNQLANLEEFVFEEVCRNIGGERKPEDEEYKKISLTLKALASSSSILKNIKLNISEEPDNDSLTASIEMSVEMRTFTWENYAQR